MSLQRIRASDWEQARQQDLRAFAGLLTAEVHSAGGRGIRGDPRPRNPVRISEEAFIQARHLLPWSLWTALVVILSGHFEARYTDPARPDPLRDTARRAPHP